MDINNKNNFEYTGHKFIYKASLTVEASIIYPMVIFIIISLLFVMKAFSSHMLIQNELEQSLSKASVRATLNEKIGKATIFSGGISSFNISKGILIPNKNKKFDYNYSYMSNFDMLPNPFINKSIMLYNNSRVKIWNGDVYKSDKNTKGEYVYVTKNGQVYHSNINCTYLKRSTRAIDFNQLNIVRNMSGGKYSACKICSRGIKKNGIIYITDYGSSYHRLSNCSELIRDIKRIPISDIGGRSRCTKCYQ